MTRGRIRERPREVRDTRAQSDIIGSLLVAFLIVIAISIVGFQLLSALQVEDSPTVDVDPTINATDVALLHAGGDDLDLVDVRVTLRNETGASTRFTLDTATIEGDADAKFEVGERAIHGHDLGGIVRVVVAHTPTGKSLHDERLVVEG